MPLVSEPRASIRLHGLNQPFSWWCSDTMKPCSNALTTPRESTGVAAAHTLAERIMVIRKTMLHLNACGVHPSLTQRDRTTNSSDPRGVVATACGRHSTHLSRAVRGDSRKRHKRQARGHVDEVRSLLGAQVRQESSTHHEEAPDVDIYLRAARIAWSSPAYSACEAVNKRA